MEYETGTDGILTDTELISLHSGIPSCQGGDSAHDRITHLKVAREVAQAQHQADIEKVKATLPPFPLTTYLGSEWGKGWVKGWERHLKAVLKALGAEMMEGG